MVKSLDALLVTPPSRLEVYQNLSNGFAAIEPPVWSMLIARYLINKGYNVYFVNSEVDKYAQIRYDYDIPWVGMNDNLCKEVSSFFSISKEDSQKIIGLWIKRKFKISDVVVVQSYLKNEVPILMVPY